MSLEKYRLVLSVIWLSSGDWRKAFKWEIVSSENRTETELKQNFIYQRKREKKKKNQILYETSFCNKSQPTL